MVCEMCHKKGSAEEIHKYAYESTASFLGGPETTYMVVYTMHDQCVNSVSLRKVEDED